MLKPGELQRRAEEDEELYERFGRQLEAGHLGSLLQLRVTVS